MSQESIHRVMRDKQTKLLWGYQGYKVRAISGDGVGPQVCVAFAHAVHSVRVLALV